MGTDGVRGPFGAQIDAGLARNLARCMAMRLPAGAPFWVGCDSRSSGPQLAAATMAGLAEGGASPHHLGLVPTGVLAWVAAQRRGHAIMLTASHNPPEHNGLKFLGPQGKLAPHELDEALSHWDGGGASDKAEASGAQGHGGAAGQPEAPEAQNLPGQLLTHLRPHLAALHPDPKPLQGKRIALDLAHGAACHFLPHLLEELGAEVCAYYDVPDGDRINLDCGTEYPEQIRRLTEREDCWLGFALDGDGDRLQVAVPGRANLDGDDLLYLHALLSPQRPAGVGGTQMTNSGLALSLRELGVAFARSPVGEQPLAALMRQRGWWLGGEPSGHLLRLDLMPSCDGSVLAALTATMLAAAGSPVDALLRGLHRYDAHLVNLRCADRKAAMATLDERAAALQQQHGEAVRTLIRPSGTEPLVRVLVESRGLPARELAESLAEGVA